MAATIGIKDIAALRKRLQKDDLEALLKGSSISDALDVVVLAHNDDSTLELLSLHLTLYRQLRYIFEEQPTEQKIADIVHSRLTPQLSPGQVCAQLLVDNIESSVRTRIARATDAMAALGRMVDVLPPPSASSSTTINPLIPLFEHAANAKNFTRSNLVILNVLIPHIPSSSIPQGLQSNIIQELDIIDAANLRCNVLADIMLRRTDDNGNSGSSRTMLEPILPLFDENQNPMILLNLTRYLLPSLFSAQPGLVQALLKHLGTGDNLSSWISVASLGVSTGHVDIAGLPSSDLQDAIVHADDAVRLRAFQLLTGGKNVLREDVMSLIRQSMVYNEVLPSAGGRSEFCSAVYSFFRKLRESQELLKKVVSSDSRNSVAKEFHTWLLEVFVDAGLEVSCRYPVVRAILALNVLKLYLDVFGQDEVVQHMVFTEHRIVLLLACQASEFAEVRSRARQIIEMSRIQLPLYDSLETERCQQLLQSCLSLLDHPRKTQAEAGKSTLCIIFRKLVMRNGETNDAIRFISSLADRLEKHLVASEQNLVQGIQTLPLHGTLAAIRDVVECLTLDDLSLQTAWQPIFSRLVGLVDRIWKVTKSVISLAPSKTVQLDKPDHEIARAYDVLGGEEDEDQAMDHTNLLSGCWRATKEAGELLATLFRLPIRQAGNVQTMWSEQQIDGAGQRFLTWMHEIRHRGTFSKISLAFTDLVDAVKTIDNLKPLYFSWLQHELDIISTDSLSTTRRSAALPYSVLAIVSSDQNLLDTAFEALIELARVDNVNSSDTTKVHAFNILKIVLLDSKQSKLLDRYFERAVMRALHAFASQNWNVRNVGLILFSTIVHRSLAPGRGTQDFFASRATLATRQTLAIWHKKYPSIIPYVTHLLGELSKTARSTAVNAHSPLFPVLIIIRSLRWSPAGDPMVKDLRKVLLPFLRSREWQVRIAAAQAMSSLLSEGEAVDILEVRLDPSTADDNALHGQLLLKRHLVAEVIHWETVGEVRKSAIEVSLAELVDSANTSTQPLIVKAIFELVDAYVQATEPTKSSLRDCLHAKAQAIVSSNTTLPGQTMAVAAAGAVLRRSDDFLGTLESSSDEDLLVPYLETLKDAKVRAGGQVIPMLGDLVQNSSNAFVRIAAIDALASVPVEGVSSAEMKGMDTALDAILESSRCVPLKEAALARLGWWLAASSSINMPLLQRLVKEADVYSSAEESQPSRYAALKAIAQISPMLYAAKRQEFTDHVQVDVHRLLLRLLQDDDEAIRIEAAESVRAGLKLNREICQKRAMELEWDFIGSRLSLSEDKQQWFHLVMEVVMDKDDYSSELKRISRKGDQGDVLFEVEPSNLFRDPLISITHASRVIRNQRTMFNEPANIWILRAALASAEAVIGEKLSPIEENFELTARIRRRAQVWKTLLLDLDQ